LKIIHYSDVPSITSDKIGITGARGLSVRPLVNQADGAQTYSMALLELAPGGSTPKHSHQRDEEIFVKAGSGIVKYSGKEASASPGSVLYIAPNEDHQFLNTADETLELLCVTQIQAE
jgi:quercetin dioxygenase-like cupin family protein